MTSEVTSTTSIIAEDAWKSLVERSINEWNSPSGNMHDFAMGFLQNYKSLDDFLRSPRELPLFWFFQRREAFLSQQTFTKWNRDRLEDYVLLPALNNFVMRSECFFVSHFWTTSNDPDPDGSCLRLHQKELGVQSWSHIWVDWTCLPQYPRTESEEEYFLRGLETMPGIIRNCGFSWFYPGFEPRLWILYEIAEYTLTCDGGIEEFEDNQEFVKHIQEMQETSVPSVLRKYGYRCSDERDKDYLTSCLEILVYLIRFGIDMGEVRRLMSHVLWFSFTPDIMYQSHLGLVQIWRFEGALEFQGQRYEFTPFPKWGEGKYSANARRLGDMEPPS
ncbi:hypothetical protein CTAM01_14980 [Colletotrichum tamarilloi]|uniref:HET domain-containing protein n=1 Tax=Colletotrichum tamarilloi TaxID=1209934 RepID=A0ABQ9QMP2_9PEZI|nr:uncharacterized protein CTAM01_14980 [Colletotrichum tamarilloi]KAK1478698.1 hypothetical protein CTAM01_14980 [Colletotrichum tamarilloi]